VLLVIAEYSVQPLADIVCCYTCYDGNQKGVNQSLSPLSVARLGFGDNADTISLSILTVNDKIVTKTYQLAAQKKTETLKPRSKLNAP